MRALILAIGLAVAACGSNPAANNAAVAEESESSAEQAQANDTTAIDAATGEAANMAADVNFMLEETNSADSANNSAAATATNNSSD